MINMQKPKHVKLNEYILNLFWIVIKFRCSAFHTIQNTQSLCYLNSFELQTLLYASKLKLQILTRFCSCQRLEFIVCYISLPQRSKYKFVAKFVVSVRNYSIIMIWCQMFRSPCSKFARAIFEPEIASIDVYKCCVLVAASHH